jgi:hypothetical protein
MESNGTVKAAERPKRKRSKRQAPSRRSVEAEYLAVLADAVPLTRWRRIVNATADLAEKDDAKSREWLARFLLGEKPPSLVGLAAEAAGGTPLGDTSLLSQLVRVRKDADHLRTFSHTEYGIAQLILGGLDRTTEDESAARGEEAKVADERVAPALPTATPGE